MPVNLGTTAAPPASHPPRRRRWRLDGGRGLRIATATISRSNSTPVSASSSGSTTQTPRIDSSASTTAVFSLNAVALPSHSPSLSTTTAARQACHLTQTLAHRPQCCPPRINAENAHIRHRCVRHSLQRSANALPSCLVTSRTDERAHPPSTHGAQRVATSKALRSRCDSSQNVTW